MVKTVKQLQEGYQHTQKHIASQNVTHKYKPVDSYIRINFNVRQQRLASER